jgi:hypothetical protein
MSMFNLENALKVLRVVGAATAKAPEFKALFDQAVTALHPADQATAKAGYADLIAENDEGHRRLQAKLAAAATEG